jgi:hypothetical protein
MQFVTTCKLVRLHGISNEYNFQDDEIHLWKFRKGLLALTFCSNFRDGSKFSYSSPLVSSKRIHALSTATFRRLQTLPGEILSRKSIITPNHFAVHKCIC